MLRSLAARPEPLVVVGVAGRPAALVVRASPEHAAALNSAAARGAPAMRTLLELGAAVVDLTELDAGADPAVALFNVNTPGDLDRAADLLVG